MRGLWKSFECIADWKRRLILFAFLAALAGMLWETNDLIAENPNHPVVAPEASLMNIEYDEYGDPIARTERIKPLPYAKVWSSSLTRLCIAFIIAIVIGSLFRSLIRGSVALVVVVVLAVLLVGQENAIESLKSRSSGSFLEPVKDWLISQANLAGHFLKTSLPSAVVAATGLIMGLMK